MAAGPFEADLAMPFGVAARGAAASPKLVAILKPGTTSWIVPRTSKYTFYVWGAGGSPVAGGAGGGAFARKTVTLQKGVVLTCSIGVGGLGAPGPSANEPVQSTTLSGGGVSITAGAGNRQTAGTASGGDLNIPGVAGEVVANSGGAAGGDGTVFGSGGLGGGNGLSGTHPGGGGGSATGSIASSGAGEIRIVDETP